MADICQARGNSIGGCIGAGASADEIEWLFLQVLLQCVPVFRRDRKPVRLLALRSNARREDTTLSQIIRMVSDAAATKAPIAKIADKVSGVFVPTVICIAVVTFIVWMLVGQTFGYALARGISVLVISCPCALGLATPVASWSAAAWAAKTASCSNRRFTRKNRQGADRRAR